MKYFNSFFAGIIFTLAPIFSIFVGLKNNYFGYYGIDEYFNSLFVDNVPVLWLAPVYLLAGYFIFYAPFRKIFRAFYAALLVATTISWIEPVGLKLGQKLFMSEPYETAFGLDENSRAKITKMQTLYVGRNDVYVIKEGADKASKTKKDAL
ncbi:isoleucyl-tRNA synthetase [uncultured Campylobacter sp.]|jgi:hypothetical protein|uniref:isoleucyl-tRNA synthetase n=1 Tax=uncultured Campylobacter sp. TaxID=218934 RepID=UPI0025CE22E9|nr:isoleucyl-tRNA synthetase [uncultured Campylobacter sp.]